MAVVTASSQALAQQPAGGAAAQPTVEARRQAGAAFNEALAARAAGNHEQSANLFETADRLAPSQAALGNAIREHRDVRTPAHDARAATLSVRLVARGGDPRAVAYATRVIEDLAPSLERVQVECRGCDVEVDQALTDDREFFLEPGPHTIVLHWSGGRTHSHAFTAERGGTESLNVEPPPERAAAQQPQPPAGAQQGAGANAAAAITAPDARAADAEGPRRGLPPAVAITGVVLTAALGGALVWSALDTLDGVPAYERDPTPDRLADGQARELRTNVLIAATAAVGVATIGALVFTRWGAGSRRVEAAPAPVVTGSAGLAPGFVLRGRF